jgi:hypothetical protein
VKTFYARPAKLFANSDCRPKIEDRAGTRGTTRLRVQELANQSCGQKERRSMGLAVGQRQHQFRTSHDRSSNQPSTEIV